MLDVPLCRLLIKNGFNQLADQDIDDLIKKAGMDGDGWVKYEEVLKMMKSEYVRPINKIFITSILILVFAGLG